MRELDTVTRIGIVIGDHPASDPETDQRGAPLIQTRVEPEQRWHWGHFYRPNGCRVWTLYTTVSHRTESRRIIGHREETL